MKERSNGSTAGYYQLPSGATQLQDLISHRNMNAQIGEIFRACYRYGLVEHSDMLRDARKILFYAKAEVDRLEKLPGESQLNSAEEPAAECDEDGWIPWKATKDSVCPVSEDTPVRVRLCNKTEDVRYAGNAYWDDTPATSFRIEAYKVI